MWELTKDTIGVSYPCALVQTSPPPCGGFPCCLGRGVGLEVGFVEGGGDSLTPHRTRWIC